MRVDETNLAQFMDTAVNDLPATNSGAMGYLGDVVGLYRRQLRLAR